MTTPPAASAPSPTVEEGMREAVDHRNPAPPPIPVRGLYYITECEHCSWVGSSEQCGGWDDDIVCPVCCSSICGDAPSEADIAKHGQAVFDRITAAEAENATLRASAERMEAAATLAPAELEWQVTASAHCGDPNHECPMQDIHAPSDGHSIARSGLRAALTPKEMNDAARS